MPTGPTVTTVDMVLTVTPAPTTEVMEVTAITVSATDTVLALAMVFMAVKLKPFFHHEENQISSEHHSGNCQLRDPRSL